MKNTYTAFLLLLGVYGCSTLFPEVDPYIHTSINTISDATVKKNSDLLTFEPSLGIPRELKVKPWAVQRNSYVDRGLAGNKHRTVWSQIERLMLDTENDDVTEVTGNLAERLEAYLGNVGTVPNYLEKSLVSSHNGYSNFGLDMSYIEGTLDKLQGVDKKILELIETQLEDVQNLRETLAEIKILEARQKEIQAALPARQIEKFIEDLVVEANRLNKKILNKDRAVTSIFVDEKNLRNELIQKENQLRLNRSDQLFFISDVADNLISNLPVLGSGWVQWATFMLHEDRAWNLRDDSLGWSMASLTEESLKQGVSLSLSEKKIVKFSADEIRSAVSWYYSLYGEGLVSSHENCSISSKIESHRDGLICDFIPGRNNCKTAALFDELMVVDDLRDNGIMIYLSGRQESEAKVGVILGVIDRDHYHVAEYPSMKTYFENELKIQNKDFSNSVSKVLYIPKSCSALSAHVLHSNLKTEVLSDKPGIILELSVRGQPMYVPVHKARIEQIPMLMKNGEYSRKNQPIDADFVDSVSRNFLNPSTRQLILTKATINTFPKGYFSKENVEKDFQNMTFIYLLELNENGEIIDSTWYYPPAKRDLDMEHSWFHIIKPTGLFYPGDLSIPPLGDLSGVVSEFRE